jgi:amino acid adenylation domain-containing protein
MSRSANPSAVAEPLEALGFWHTELSGLSAGVDLPKGLRRRTGGRTARTRRDRTVVTHAGDGAGNAPALLVALGVLLSRLSSMDDLVVWASPRMVAEAAGARGEAAGESALPLRLSHLGTRSAAEAVAEVRKRAEAASAQCLVEPAGLRKLLTAPDGADTVGARLAGEREPAADLLLTVDPGAGTLALTFDVDLFDEAVAEGLLDSLTVLAAATADATDAELADLPLLSDGARTRILGEWSGPPPVARTFVPVHEQIAAGAARFPEHTALTSGERRLTYRELDDRANQLAHHLRGLDVGPGDLVALCVSRSPEMIVGMLATLRAGAAYLPVDPGYPTARIAFMLDDAAPAVLLTESALRDRLPAADRGPRRIELDTDRPRIARGPATAPEHRAAPDDLAYVIYTSGSTGRPKGVEIPHAGLANLVAWHCETYGLTDQDHTAQIAGTAFDAAAWEIWPSLAAGATLHLSGDTAPAPASDLVRWFTERRITVSFLPTPLAELVLDEPWPADCALRTLLTGGDALHRQPPNGLPFALVNHYGPTESSVVATAVAVPAAPDGQRREPPIGRPISNTRCYVLDERMQPVPAGMPGELYIGGTGLARGYLNRPELTRERFVANPFGDGRLYRTGDLVSWRSDGNLDFLGRVDHQVKLRGLRIELGEIESALTTHPELAEAAVTMREDTPGHARLVGYLVPRSTDVPGDDALRTWLGAHLPAYMVPSVFMALDALPLTRNGKVDRRALPEPPAGRDAQSEPYDEPRPGTEATVAALWSDMLGVQRIGARDDFFRLGGDSLAATRIVARLRDAFAVALPVSTVLAEPTVRGVATAVDTLKADSGHTVPDPIVPVERGAQMPLTAAQRQLWLLDRIDAGAGTYNIPLALELTGPLRTDLLQAALRDLVARHEALRTTFPTVDGEPVQRVGAVPREVPLPVVDASAVDDIDAWITARSQEPLDVGRGPLLRTVLLRRAAQDHLLLVVIHHVVFDGWSLGVFCRELGELYLAYAEGRTAELPELPVQSVDVAVWQGSAAAHEALAAERAYWPGALEGAPPHLELPTDRPRPERPTPDGARRIRRFDARLTSRIEEFARAEGSTPFMTLLGAFDVLLSRYSGATDIVVGSPVAGRVRPELEPVIGCFINTLPLRVDLAGRPGFRELIGRVRRVCTAAHAHQDLPLSSIIDLVRPDRSSTQTPLFQVVFAFEDAHDAEFAFGGVRARVSEIDFRMARSDLGISITPVGGELRVCAEYRSELFTEERVDRLLAQFETLLEHALARPDTPVAALPLVTADEQRRIVEEWNDTASPFDDAATLHQLVERQVDRTPDAVAVVFEDEATLTYRQLDERANQLAHHLRALGVGPETRVGVCLHRSPDMVVAVLGVLKAGGGYVPLDPANPAERLAFITADAEMPVVISERDLRHALADADALIVEVDTRRAEIAERPTTRPEHLNGVHDLAYVIYTSGSTGRPKGVMIEHRSVSNFMTTVHDLFVMGPHDRVLQFASLGFDVSVFEIFGALTIGARLCLARQDTLLSVKGLTAFMQRHEISVMDMPPSVMALLPGDVFPALRIAFVGGEAFSGGLVNRWSVPGRRFFNGYGPTEGTVTVIVEECTGDTWETPPPIGRPMPNMRAYVLDAEQQLVPVGLPGELYIGGAGLARGYLNRPELTAERFVRDPFLADEGARLYRTGDLVRQLPDGRLDFLGRVDDQVKLRGFRIELGEVESVLGAHPDVSDVAVLLREDTPGVRRLVGYVVPALPHKAPSAAELSAHLGERLPPYMVPTAFLTLAKFPLNASGKIDRKVLPAPDAQDLVLAEDVVEPRNGRERALVEIWKRLLGLERVGVHDNFFALGGQSLLAVQFVWEVHQAFGVEIALRDVFEKPTVAGLAGVVEEAMLALLDAGRVPGLEATTESKEGS